MNESLAPPIPLKPDHIPSDLICAICMSLPTQVPVLTPCQHLFCRPCLDQALALQPCCPIDRSPIPAHQRQEVTEGSFVHRIWGSIPVKCAQHVAGCSWTGAVVDYPSHWNACECRDQQHQQSLQELRQENQSLLAVIRDNKEKIKELRLLVERTGADSGHVTRQRFDQLQNTNTVLSEKLQAAEQEIPELKQRIEAGDLFNASYNYPRERVVGLSQLICRHLEARPAHINASRIYSCVEARYRDLLQNYGDNPPHYRLDMHMLLTICHASTWFSGNQRSRIGTWMREQSWL